MFLIIPLTVRCALLLALLPLSCFRDPLFFGIFTKQDEQPAWVTDAHRRKRAVFANFEEVPQPAEAQHIRDIVDAVRQWSVCESDTWL